jgi:hypothetical protein
MIVKLIRFSSQENSTLGLLYIDGGFQCFTIEDEFRTEKVMHETRIPEGIYELGIRDEGGFHERYKSKFKGIHKGMIQVMDVPNFEYILLHIGNWEDQTSGCLLLGNSAKQNVTGSGMVIESKIAYLRVYPLIMRQLQKGKKVYLNIETIG